MGITLDRKAEIEELAENWSKRSGPYETNFQRWKYSAAFRAGAEHFAVMLEEVTRERDELGAQLEKSLEVNAEIYQKLVQFEAVTKERNDLKARLEAIALQRMNFLNKCGCGNAGCCLNIMADLEQRLEVVTKERDEAIQVRVGYDRKFTAGIFLTDYEYTKSAEREKVMREALWRAEKLLDGIIYELECSVYTLTDDEFGTVFFVRDICQEALARAGKLT